MPEPAPPPTVAELWGHYKANLQAYLDDELVLLRLLREGALPAARDVVAGLEGRGRILKHLEAQLDGALLPRPTAEETTDA